MQCWRFWLDFEDYVILQERFRNVAENDIVKDGFKKTESWKAKSKKGDEIVIFKQEVVKMVPDFGELAKYEDNFNYRSDKAIN